MTDVPDPQVQTKAQLLSRFRGTQPEQLLYRDLIETLYTLAIDEVAAIEGVIGDGGSTAQSIPRSTTAALEAVANAINTTGKFAGKVVINTTAGTIVTADGPLVDDEWNALDGTTAHTPV